MSQYIVTLQKDNGKEIGIMFDDGKCLIERSEDFRDSVAKVVFGNLFGFLADEDYKPTITNLVDII